MYTFRITCDNGTINIVRARNRTTAIKLFCEAEGCSIEWVAEHCVVRNVTNKKNRRGMRYENNSM
jgi:hypothetical protein